jgi:hypothetical protein
LQDSPDDKLEGLSLPRAFKKGNHCYYQREKCKKKLAIKDMEMMAI